MRESQLRFIRQLGYTTPAPDQHLYAGLMLQPRIVGAVTLLGILTQSPWLFLGLSAALGWSTLFPRQSLFDALYNYGVAYPRGLAPVGAAPQPRRFAEGLAGTVALAIAVALFAGVPVAAWLGQALLAVAAGMVVFRQDCAGASLYEVLRRSVLRRPQQSV